MLRARNRSTVRYLLLTYFGSDGLSSGRDNTAFRVSITNLKCRQSRSQFHRSLSEVSFNQGGQEWALFKRDLLCMELAVYLAQILKLRDCGYFDFWSDPIGWSLKLKTSICWRLANSLCACRKYQNLNIEDEFIKGLESLPSV